MFAVSGALVMSTEGRTATAVLHSMPKLDKAGADALRGNETLQRFCSGAFDCCYCTFKNARRQLSAAAVASRLTTAQLRVAEYGLICLGLTV